MRPALLCWSTSIAILLCAAATAPAATIRVQSTTDTVDAGLVDGYHGAPGIKALFAQWEAAEGLPSDTLAYVGVGSGAALDNARGGQADVVIAHAPSLEARFVAQGYSHEPLGRAIFSSDYVIIGPRADPAGVLASAPHDAVSAFERIAAAGARGHAVFASRGDDSGTNVQEQRIWGLTGDGAVAKQAAANGEGDAERKEPVGGAGPGRYPAWYVKTDKGQAANVQQCDATANCYTMTDRGTFNRLVNSGTLTALEVVDDHNTAAARGGEELLVNPFTAYVVDPGGHFPGGAPKPDVAAATRFVDFLTSERFQAAVDMFPSVSDPAFHADAFPKLAATTPPVALAGERTTLHLVLSDRLPGGPPISGMPVQLQQSTDGGATFTDVGGPSPTSATGAVRFRPVIARTTTFRISLPRHGKFSPSRQTVGVVAAAEVPARGPAAGRVSFLLAGLQPVELTGRRFGLAA